MNDFIPMKLNEMLKGAVSYPRLTSAELAEGDFATNYLVEGVLAEAQPTIIGGAKKCLKTSIIIDLSIAIATGRRFLGRFKVHHKRRVAVMSGESGLGTIQETARRISKTAQTDLSEIDNLFWTTSLPKLGQTAHLTAFERFLRDDEIEVVAVDPAYLCMPSADAGNLFAQGELLSGISSICQASGVTLLLAHHTRKSRKAVYDPPELDDLSWSGFAEFARQWILLGRRQQYEPGTGDHRLWMSIGGSAGHSGLWAVDVAEGQYDGVTPCQWHITVSSSDEARAKTKVERNQKSLEAAKDKLLMAVRRHPAGETRNVLFTEAGINGTRGKQALTALIDENFVRIGTVSKSGREFEAVIPR